MKRQSNIHGFSFSNGLKLTLATGLCLLSHAALASPHPAVATSALVAPKIGIVKSPLGFEIEAGTSGWTAVEAPNQSKFVQAIFRAPARKDVNESQLATLTVRVEELKKPTSLLAYTDKWKDEFPKFGFDVLGSKSFKINSNDGYVFDLINRQSKRKVRQVIFLKQANAVILTCKDGVETFADSLKGCNQIVRTFRW